MGSRVIPGLFNESFTDNWFLTDQSNSCLDTTKKMKSHTEHVLFSISVGSYR